MFPDGSASAPVAAMAEKYSEHPLAKAVVRLSKEHGIEVPAPDEFQAEIGMGVSAVSGGKEVTVGKGEFLREEGVATPSRQNVSFFSSNSSVRRLWHDRIPAKNSSVEKGRLRTTSISSMKMTTFVVHLGRTTWRRARIHRCKAPNFRFAFQ